MNQCNEMLSLDVAISTYRQEGILKVAKMLEPLPPQKGVRYIVSWQEHQDREIPQYLQQRDDVEVFRLEKKGLSNNRNNAISHCKADLVLIADDDLEYKQDFAVQIKKVFEDNPHLDLALFKINFQNRKIYPAQSCIITLSLPENYYAASVEMAFKRDKFKDLKFNTQLGLGAPLMHCGEEEIFLLNALKSNLVCRFFPVIIASHQEFTTGDKVSPGILRGHGYVIRKYYPVTFPLRIPLKAYRIKKYKKFPFFKSLKYLCQGMVYSFKNKFQ